MYVDSVYAKTFKEVAKLVSPMTTVPLSGCLSFQYQQSDERVVLCFHQGLHGPKPGAVEGRSTQSDWIGTLSEWMPVQVDLKAPYTVQVNMNVPGLTK